MCRRRGNGTATRLPPAIQDQGARPGSGYLAGPGGSAPRPARRPPRARSGRHMALGRHMARSVRPPVGARAGRPIATRAGPAAPRPPGPCRPSPGPVGPPGSAGRSARAGSATASTGPGLYGPSGANPFGGRGQAPRRRAVRGAGGQPGPTPGALQGWCPGGWGRGPGGPVSGRAVRPSAAPRLRRPQDRRPRRRALLLDRTLGLIYVHRRTDPNALPTNQIATIYRRRGSSPGSAREPPTSADPGPGPSATPARRGEPQLLHRPRHLADRHLARAEQRQGGDLQGGSTITST
jgi:hypothetical protein